ncbi:MAG: ribosomal protein S6--L-glutamate ligase [Myxococcota bacterium]|jgi:ribosomal protein S6--L-glutamate ligase
MDTMRITFLSHSAAFYSTRRLMDAALRLGHGIRRVDPTRVLIRSISGRAEIQEDGEVIRPPDVLLPRVGSRLTEWSLSIVDAWRRGGVGCAIDPQAIARAADKLSCHLALGAAGLPTLPMIAVREPAHIEDALTALGCDAFVLKRRYGTGGKTVALAPDRRSARSMLSALIDTGEPVLVEPFIEMEHPRDLRVLVTDYEVLAACYRVAVPGEFRANVHRGGTTLPATLDAATEALAVKAARAVGLGFCGVDILETPDGPIILEVNGSPGLQGIEAAVQTDLATPFVERYIRASTKLSR